MENAKTPPHLQFPQQFTFGGSEWSFEYLDRRDIDGAYGLADFHNRKVVVATDVSMIEVLNTVLHEVQHVIHHVYQMTHHKNEDVSFTLSVTEENVATATGNGWSDIFLNNPGLLRWMTAVVAHLRRKK